MYNYLFIMKKFFIMKNNFIPYRNIFYFVNDFFLKKKNIYNLVLFRIYLISNLERNNAKLTVELFIIFGLTSSSNICMLLFPGSNKTSATPIAYANEESEIVLRSAFGQIFSKTWTMRIFPSSSLLYSWEKTFLNLG